jgi:hypothetical protein
MATKIKGIKKLNKTISIQLHPFGIDRAECTDEYSYQYDNNVVTFKLTENTIEDIWFNEFIKERFGYDVRYPFVMSILHEIGHSKYNEEIEGVLYKFCLDEKERIEDEMQTADAETAKKLSWEYFNLPDEIMATYWAVEYAKAHPIKCKKMWKKMREALFEFYEKNNIIDWDWD